ncbi:unnamed protein product [Moneuplotes crassus]|uniref:Uncharacterized protein n=1 Tax=Euplotes crassus TaxID=5936 RepID=A0AAD1YAB7_EUPCR|nr:unnamed protein product [Moneuplotes crassus]
MDFIIFKFHHDHKEKTLLIRRDDITLGYLRLQTRKLFKMQKNFRFAISYELIKPGHENDESPNRHYYCSRPDERPEKLLMNDQQLAKIRKGRRKNHHDTAVRIIVHTTPNIVGQYYQQASPIKNRSIGSKNKKRNRSSSSKRNIKSTPNKGKRAKSNTKEIVKIKADNTYDYSLPPSVWEVFLKSMLNNPDNIEKLKLLYNNSPIRNKKYNISDFINPTDLLVRKMETELGIQGRSAREFKSPSKDWCTCDTYDSDDTSNAAASVIHHRRNKLSLDSRKSPDLVQRKQTNAAQVKEIERKFMDVGYDSDDVFANNPSTLMGAKYKVVRKFEKIKEDPPPPPLPKDDKCPICKKPKLVDTISQYNTIQSRMNGTVSINSEKFQSPHYRRGKDTDSDTFLGKSIAERTHSVKQPKKIIRKKRKRSKKSQANRSSMLSTPRRCLRECCIHKRKAEEEASSQRSISSRGKSTKEFNFSSSAVMKSVKRNKLNKTANIDKISVGNGLLNHQKARTENTSILKEGGTVPSLKQDQTNPGLTYQLKNFSKQKLRFNLAENSATFGTSQQKSISQNSSKGIKQTLKNRVKIIKRNSRKPENPYSSLRPQKPARQKNTTSSNPHKHRKYTKPSPKLLKNDFIPQDSHNQTFNLTQNIPLQSLPAHSQTTSKPRPGTHYEYSSHHQTLNPRSDLPKFVRPITRKRGFKSTIASNTAIRDKRNRELNNAKSENSGLGRNARFPKVKNKSRLYN